MTSTGGGGGWGYPKSRQKEGRLCGFDSDKGEEVVQKSEILADVMCVWPLTSAQVLNRPIGGPTRAKSGFLNGALLRGIGRINHGCCLRECRVFQVQPIYEVAFYPELEAQILKLLHSNFPH